MAGKIAWSEAAWNDLAAAADYIARDSPRYAAAFVREVREAARSLRHFAERGRIVPEISDPSIRELLVRNFRLIYLMGENQVHILALVHGARDLWVAWDAKPRGPS